MRAALLYGKEDLRIQEVAVPQIRASDILLKVKTSFICGTDVRMYRNGYKGVSEDSPLILGHEFSGIILKTGKNVKGYEEGMAVSVAPNIGCGVCKLCISGNTHLCPDYRGLGIHLNGGFAECVKIPETFMQQGNIHEIPVGLSFEEAAIVEPLSCVYNGFTKCDIRSGDTVLIIGGGPIGIMHAKLARMAGAGKIFINDISEDRLARCRKSDPFFTTITDRVPLQTQILDLTDGRGVDVCITACPVPHMQTLALELTAINGRVLYFGGLPADKADVNLNTNLIHYKQLLVTGTTRSSPAQFRKTIQLLVNGEIEVMDLITSRSNLDETRKTIENVSKGIGLKSAISFA